MGLEKSYLYKEASIKSFPNKEVFKKSYLHKRVFLPWIMVKFLVKQKLPLAQHIC